MATDISPGLRRKLEDPELTGFLQVQILVGTPDGLNDELRAAMPCADAEEEAIVNRHYTQEMGPMMAYLQEHGILHNSIPLEGFILAQLTGEELEHFIQQDYKGHVMEYRNPTGEE